MKILKTVAGLALILAFGLGAYLRHSESISIGGGEVTAIVVEDSAHRTPQIGAVLTDPAVLAYVAQKNIVWRVIDRAESGPDVGNVQFAREATQNCQLPALVLRVGAGKPKVCALPTAKNLLTLLKHYAG